MIKAFRRYFTGSARSSSNWRLQPRPRTSHALQTLKRGCFLENTLIIFDEHGIRYTEVGKTLQGKLEERLPFMSNTVPRWFTEKYPDLYKNFVHNSKVLTTLFDVYAILRHILSYPNYPGDTITGQSLFTKIYKRSPLSIKWSWSLFTKSQQPVCIVLHPYPKVTYSVTTHMN